MPETHSLGARVSTESSLAIDGGTPVYQGSWPPWPFFETDTIDAASRVLQSGRVNYWTGEEGRAFEREWADACGTEYGIAMANGTVALEAALLASGVGPGDEVITTSRTFVASASAAVTIGAVPVFADVDRDSQCITAATIEPRISSKTRAIVAVHLAGWPCEMRAIRDLAAAHDLVVIEDCAQAHGATYHGDPVGGLAHVAAWSFCQDKILTTGGEGGAITTNDEALWSKAWSLKDHGKSYDAVYRRNHAPGFRWVHESFGSNWRLTEMQSAIGRVLIRRLPEWLARRRANAFVLEAGFGEMSALRVTVPPAHVGHAYYKYYVFIQSEALKAGWSRDRIMNAVSAEGVPCFSGSCSEIYLEKSFRDAGLAPPERLPVARELSESSLMFLVHPTIGASEMNRTVDAVSKVLVRASR